MKDMNRTRNLRYKNTIRFLNQVLPSPATILDLGTKNPLGELMEKSGYNVFNTKGEDLDENPSVVSMSGIDAVTSFEVFEHLLNPYQVLKTIEAPKLIASVPLNLWFSKAYRSHTDEWDRHYHEFEDWQFDWLLEKTGWKIIKKEKWVGATQKIGFRPLLRKFTPRFYIVYAER